VTWWQVLVSVAAGLVLLWLAGLLVLWRVAPGGTRLAEALRLLPDLLRLLRRLAADPTLPRGVRIRLVLLLGYLALPFDLVPDVIPVLGYADDAIVVAVALRAVARRAGPEALARHWPGTPEGLAVVHRLVGLQPTPDRAGGDEGRPGLGTVLREWGWIGCIGFGGPPTHIKLLRDLCVERKRWLTPVEFEDAVAACNLLPGPASTQLAIFCAWRVRGHRGALLGGAAFIVPGLVVILALAALFLAGTPPRAVLAAGAGAGSAVAAVAVHAAAGLLPASWCRARTAGRASRLRWIGYVAAGLAAAAIIGPWLVLVLLACGTIEVTVRLSRGTGAIVPLPLLAAGPVAAGALLPLTWVALKVGALSYGGGFVIIPLMQTDAVDHYHWMTSAQFLNAVALGQVTPGPVVQTVAVVGYAAAGLVGGILAAVVAFTPSFAFVLLGAGRFDRLRDNARVRAFLDGAGPAAIGAILGSAVTLARVLSEPWQFAILAAAAVLLLVLRRGVVLTLLAAAAGGVVLVASGLALPH
jgi:chromate transporter